MRSGNFALFIPLQGCPNHCIYCDQKKISGKEEMSPEKAGDILNREMPAWCKKGLQGQIAFFGGTFTGLSMNEMKAYLAVAAPYVKNGAVDGIRISTRPDYINQDILSLLQEYNVTHIELGVQSLDDQVLRRAGRCYTAETVEQSSKLICDHGFVLGLQMMPGLPGDTREKSILTAERIIALGAKETRIYPTVVIKETPLAQLYEQGSYVPMQLDAAVDLCAELKQRFEEKGVTVLKIGLHSGAVEKDILAGPFHPSFGQLVDSKICLEQMITFCQQHSLENTTLFVTPNRFDASDIVGQCRVNAGTLLDRFGIILKISKKVLTNEKNSIII